MKEALQKFWMNFTGENISLPEEKTLFPDMPKLGEVLPYVAYSRQDELYVLKNGVGFCIESPPYVGTGFDPKKTDNIRHFLKSFLPEGASLEFLLVASPLIQDQLEGFKSIKGQVPLNADLYNALSERRYQFFKERALFGKTRDFRLYISLRIPCEKITEDIKQQIKLLRVELQSIFTHTRNVDPEGLRSLLNQFFTPLRDLEEKRGPIRGQESFEGQLLDLHVRREVNQSRIKLDDVQSPETEGGVMDVTGWPDIWNAFQSTLLIGSPTNPYGQIETPFMIHMGVSLRARSKKLELKGQRLIRDKTGPLAKFIPGIIEEAQEWERYFEEIEKGEKPLYLSMGVYLTGDPDTLSQNMSKARALYGEQGLILRETRFVVLPRLLSMVPLSWGPLTVKMLEAFSLGRLTLTSEAASMSPVFGELKGTYKPTLLLQARRGQLMNWSPFDSNTNYNVAIAGASGSGKSVLMQEIITQHLSEGARVVVVDVGGSYRKIADLLGGVFIEFDPANPKSMNPFQEVAGDEEDQSQALNMISDLVSKMAYPHDVVDGEILQFISKGVQKTWAEKGNNATISDVADTLEHMDAGDLGMGRRIALRLYPYTKDQTYWKFFNHSSEISLNHDFVCLELESLKNIYPDLQPVVLQMMILKIARELYMGDRSRSTIVVIDEAWDLLGSTGQGGSFIETAARRFRKYRGSLIVGTQGIADFFKTPAGEAAFTNSAWKLILQQDRQAISDIINRKLLGDMDDYKSLLESIHTQKGKYSEVAILREGNIAVGRLYLDAFSSLLYSTTAEEFDALQQLTQKGYSLQEAIIQMIEDKSV